MTLRHLKIFVAVAETKSMSAAARPSMNWRSIITPYYLNGFPASFTSQKPERIFSPMPGR